MPKVKKFDKVPDKYKCPISEKIMSDPVIMVNQKIYERKAIEEWLKHHDVDPISKKSLANKTSVSDIRLKNEILKYLKKKKIFSDEEFINAVNESKLSKLKEYKYYDKQLDIICPSGMPILHLAASKGDISIMQIFINDKIDILNRRDSESRTPLHVAAFFGREAMINKLLSYDKMSVNRVDNYKATALHLACSNKNDESGIVESLIRHGAAVNAGDINGNTPLHRAAESGNLAIVKKLMEEGANCEASNNEGKTPADVAVDRGHVKIATVILSQTPSLLEKKLEKEVQKTDARENSEEEEMSSPSLEVNDNALNEEILLLRERIRSLEEEVGSKEEELYRLKQAPVSPSVYEISALAQENQTLRQNLFRKESEVQQLEKLLATYRALYPSMPERTISESQINISATHIDSINTTGTSASIARFGLHSVPTSRVSPETPHDNTVIGPTVQPPNN